MAIHPISLGKTPDKVAELVLRDDLSGKRVLDLGAGKGYMCQRIAEGLTARGLNPADILRASDLSPGNFELPGIVCDYGDFNRGLPYPDAHFDVVCLVEVLEHIENQFECIREIRRILKPGGTLYLSTPNILNMNSRIRYFTSGQYSLFSVLPHRGAIDMASAHGHVNPISFVHLSHILKRNGFAGMRLHVDRLKTSAVAWAVLFYPLIRLWAHFIFAKLRKSDPKATAENEDVIGKINSFPMLTSRTLIVEAKSL